MKVINSNKVLRFYKKLDRNNEVCYNIEVKNKLSKKEVKKVKQRLNNPKEQAFFDQEDVIEIGPRLNFSTPFSTNAVSVFNNSGIDKIIRVEKSLRTKNKDSNYDRMTQQLYDTPIDNFNVKSNEENIFEVPIIEEGEKALIKFNNENGLEFDKNDILYYMKLFEKDFKRNPTNIELFDLAQSNSEHCRHWFFNSELVIYHKRYEESLFDIIKSPIKVNPNNTVINFKDNSSAIRGFNVDKLTPKNPGHPSKLELQNRDMDILLTAETHNFPCSVSPLPGSETGAGGRMRDTHSTGTGSYMGAGLAGYCTGNLWNDREWRYPNNLEKPLKILIESSNGASDYGNKFGEPLIGGFTRTYGEIINNERREWIKPIMYSSGIGQIDRIMTKKKPIEKDMLVVKIGGPAYKVGVGGGTASSSLVDSDREHLDFNAVQRGDAEMGQKLWRVVKACIEMNEKNPIISIHDQGAGGNCNVLKEIVNPLGGLIDISKLEVGDKTMNSLELWVSEYQENDCLLIKPKSLKILENICTREKLFLQVVGKITGDGMIRVDNGKNKNIVNLELDKVLNNIPRKMYLLKKNFDRGLVPVEYPTGNFIDILENVLRLPSVCSKRFLTTKVDRSVTGLVAQQQCCGPLNIPVSNVSVMAQSFNNFTGMSVGIGEQPIKGLINPERMARLSITESLTNIMWANLTSLEDIKMSINWMYASKLGTEGSDMFDVANSLKDFMIGLGIACDGGKDSLSMFTKFENELVKCPGSVVITSYCSVKDITKTVTPDLKSTDSALIYVNIGNDKKSLGGSAFLQSIHQLGDDCPDTNIFRLQKSFNIVQELIEEQKILSGHDISDGGLITTLLEMSFAGNIGIDINVEEDNHIYQTFFAEEPGFIIEISKENFHDIVSRFEEKEIKFNFIGKTNTTKDVNIYMNSYEVFKDTVPRLRDVWEETSFKLEKLQCENSCVNIEKESLKFLKSPKWKIDYNLSFTDESILQSKCKHKVAILREEGTNGDREMAAAVYFAGMEPWDITMTDLLNKKVSLSQFRGLIFPGGFSYADTLGSATGWANVIKNNDILMNEIQNFYKRNDTFSLGVCNGCQLMMLLNLISDESHSFEENTSKRFESRFVQVKIEKSNSIMLKGMENSIIGIHVAHGEGKLKVSPKIQTPIKYLSDTYPECPNGSKNGITSLCSDDGRHLAMMPHPERAFLGWQLPHSPLDKKGPGPWLKMFQNARIWCDNN